MDYSGLVLVDWFDWFQWYETYYWLISVIWNQLLIDFRNMKPIIDLPGGDDQAWFFMVAGQVESECAPALCGIVRAQQVR